MKMNKHFRNVLYGFLAWLIPFIASFPFFTKDGGLSIDIFLFKTIMIIVGSISASILLVSYFKRISTSYLKEGIYIGVSWFIINILLDLVVLIPMSGMAISDYLLQIGLRYLVMPVMATALGVALTNKK